LAVLSFAAGVYSAVTSGSAPKLKGGVVKAVETADAPTKGRSDNAPTATADRRRFTKRTVKFGLVRDGYVQILAGIAPGDRVATEGALFLSNALAIAAR
jgi:hypothetical protein